MNILTQLQELSVKIRPLPLETEGFDIKNDVFLKKLDMGGSRLDMDAALRTYPAKAALVTRLREGIGRVQGDTVDPNEDPPNYDWLIRASVDFNGDADQEEESKKRSKK